MQLFAYIHGVSLYSAIETRGIKSLAMHSGLTEMSSGADEMLEMRDLVTVVLVEDDSTVWGPLEESFCCRICYVLHERLMFAFHLASTWMCANPCLTARIREGVKQSWFGGHYVYT